MPLYTIESSKAYKVAQTFDFPDNKARLKVSVFSHLDSNQAHENPYDDEGNLKPGFKEWPLVFLDVPDLDAAGFKKEKAKASSKRYYSVNGLVQMLKFEDRLLVNVVLFGPGQAFREAKGKCYL
jgi:hypothetical protein